MRRRSFIVYDGVSIQVSIFRHVCNLLIEDVRMTKENKQDYEDDPEYARGVVVVHSLDGVRRDYGYHYFPCAVKFAFC